MPRKTTTPAPARRDRPTSYRWGAETRRQLAEIAAALADPLGRPLPETEVLREAVRRLHASLVKSGRRDGDA
jgi:hypothetical protein